jgi:hypothetical protein
MLIYVKITDRQTHQKYSSEPHNNNLTLPFSITNDQITCLWWCWRRVWRASCSRCVCGGARGAMRPGRRSTPVRRRSWRSIGSCRSLTGARPKPVKREMSEGVWSRGVCWMWVWERGISSFVSIQYQFNLQR